MSELDDLRRVAYGRTASVADEAAAAEARAALHAREHSLSAAEPEPQAWQTEPEAVGILETEDPSGYLRRLRRNWRRWAGPAFVAFVFGVVLTAASWILLLNVQRAEVGTAESGETVIGEATLVSEPGDLDAAEALLRSPQEPKDVVETLDSGMDIGSMHLVRETNTQLVYVGRSVEDDICLMVVESASGDSLRSCAPPSAFAKQGVYIGRIPGGESMRLHWNGVNVVESRAPQ